MLKKCLGLIDKISRKLFPLPSSKLADLQSLPPVKIKEKRLGDIVIYALFSYKNDKVSKVILDLKKYGYAEYANFFGSALADFLLEKLSYETLWNNSQIIVASVPLHKSKLRKRGFDQNELVLHALAEKLQSNHLTVKTNLLKRIKKTKEQKNLSKSARKENVKGAFMVKNPEDLLGVNQVVLVDDIVTSGATLKSARKAMRKAGFKGDILLLALAKS